VQVARSLTEQEAYLATFRRNLFIGSGVAVLVSFVSGWLLSGYVLRPVETISHTARAIGAERDFGRRVQYDGPDDEIGRLATTFNTMLGGLEAAYRQQQQFVADVSHELRTPLTTIRGNLELLRREPPVSDDDRPEVLSDMAAETERLIRLVNDLLFLARAEARQSLHSEAVPVRPLVDDVCRQARLLGPERSITCEPLPNIAVAADRDGLKQVLLILLDNALRHTTGPITVSAVPRENSLELLVADSGPGIAPDVLPRIFERFYRGGGPATATEPGLGLGLPIAKALIEAQNGSLSVESVVENGSVFTVTVPLANGVEAV
jgi:signal transduction histidine kinase